MKDLKYIVVDWYHCYIFQKRFLFIYELICIAELDINNNLKLHICDSSLEKSNILPTLATNAKQRILYQRNQ